MCVCKMCCVCVYTNISTLKDAELEGDIHFWTMEACFSKVTIRKCSKILQVKELSFQGSEYWHTGTLRHSAWEFSPVPIYAWWTQCHLLFGIRLTEFWVIHCWVKLWTVFLLVILVEFSEISFISIALPKFKIILKIKLLRMINTWLLKFFSRLLG